MQVTVLADCISLQNLQQAKVSFYFILFKNSIFSCEKTQFLCMKPSFRNDRLASQASFILLSYSIFPFNRQAWFHQHLQTDKLWQVSKDISPLKVLLSPTHDPQEQGAFLGKKTSAIIMSLFLLILSRHTFLKAKRKRKEIDFVIFPPLCRAVLKMSRIYQHCFSQRP